MNSSIINMGNLGPIQIFEDWVGSSDRYDYYQFNLLQNSIVKFNLSGLDEVAYIDIYDDKNQLLKSQYFSGKNTDKPLSFNLNSGTYYARISNSGSGSNYTNTPYKLEASATEITDPVGNGTTNDIGFLSSNQQTLQSQTASVSDSGGYEGSYKSIILESNGGGTAQYFYQHYTIPDNFIIRYEGKNLLKTGFVGGSNTGTVQIPAGNSNKLEVIVATNDEGTAWNYNVTVTTDNCPDTTPLKIEAANGQFEDTDGDGDCDAQGTIYIGRTDGISRMLRVEGATAEYDDKSLKVTGGTVFSEIGNVSEPLFEGDFEISFSSATTSSLNDNSRNSTNDFRIGGLDVNFNKLSLNRNRIGLGSKFTLPGDVGGIEISSVVDAISIKQNGVSMGVGGKLSIPDPPKFSFFKLFDVEASALSLEYDAIEEKLKLQGKLTMDSFVRDTLFEKITADLSEDNFVQIKDGKADVKGSLIVESNIKTKKGWGLNEVKLDVDTTDNILEGRTKLTFPFKGRIKEAELEMDFKLGPPLELNKVTVDVDNLNVPIPGYPLVFLQDINGELNNLAPSVKDSTEFNGNIHATLGPKIGDLSLIYLDLDAKISSEELSGTGKMTILNDKIATAQGTHTLNWKKKFYEKKGSFSILDGLIETNNSLKVDSNFNMNMSGRASANVPNFIPLIGGTNINGNFALDFSNDGKLSNDFAAVWTTIQKKFFGIDINLNLGLKGFFDGRLRLISSRLPPTNSFIVAPDTPWILLSADWENNDENVQIRIEKPDGSFIEEADFTENNIAIFEDLTDSDTRTAVIVNPTPGIWDIEVVDDSGLGTVEYSGVGASDVPTIEITSSNIDVNGEEVTINYEAFDSDSNAEIKLFYDTDNDGFDGILIADGLVENDGAGSFVWDTQGVANGNYFIYGMIMDDNNIPVYSYSSGEVEVTEEADLSVLQTVSSDSISVGETFTYTVKVVNNGLVDSEGVTLVETLPEDVTFVSASLAPSEQVDNVLTFDLNTLASGESITVDVTVTAPAIAGTITNNVYVSSNTFDAETTNNVNILTTTVAETLPEFPDLEVTRTEDTTSVPLGTTYSYTLDVTNNGSGNATGVVLTENLPSGLNIISATAETGSQTNPNFVDIIELQLDAGEKVTIDIDAIEIGSMLMLLNSTKMVILSGLKISAAAVILTLLEA